MAIAAVMYTGTAWAQQPYGGCWHPDDIKNWSPQTDPDAKFNRARVPLAKRFKEPTLMKANPNQHYEGQITDATILFPICSMCPSQGANNFLGYQPTYWQYMDKLVYWAGSASEGIIIPPPAGSTDAAHQSGVKSLGQVFFPPSEFGGTQAWVRQMLTVEDGVYIYAKKLYEIAKYMGFDGWFINEETGGGSVKEWVGFIKQFNELADQNGDTQMEIQWYNASTLANTDILTSHKNTSQFLEYGSPGDYRNYSEYLGCTVEETFAKIYGGVQVVKRGHTGYDYYLNEAMPTSGHVGSLALFCPEERIWKDNVKKLLGKNDTGEQAYAATQNTFKKEMEMWVNTQGDPSADIKSGWPGLSGRMIERSAITAMPFTSSFCVGVGKHRFVEGQKQGTHDWYHSGVQSIMPTYRWWIENKGDLKADIDWDDAYNFGSSIKVSGTLSAGDHLMRLYKTEMAVSGAATLRLVYKTSTAGSVEVKLSTESSTTPDVTLSAPVTTEKNGWTVADYDLSALGGKTIYLIALNLKADAEVAGYELHLGELSVLPAAYAPAAVEVNNLATTSTLGEAKGDIRLTWDYDYTADFDHFDIYTQSETGTRTLVGQTRDEAFYIPSFDRKGTDAYVNVDVVPVMKDMKQQPAKTLKVDYPKATAPVVTFSLGKSYIKVGESTTITAHGTGSPTAWRWTLPEGLALAEGSAADEQGITVVATAPGKMKVTVEATNAIGTSTTSEEVLDVMATDGEMNEVYNVVQGKKVVAYSGSTNSTEVPDKIIDGVRKPTATSAKWCNVSSDNWATFDCLGDFRIYGFRIYDGNSGPESGVDQIDSYKIQLSDDGENWTTVVDAENRADESIKTDYIPPFKARYVKLIPHVNGTLRIWEFEVYGKDDNNMTIEMSPAALKMNVGETRSIVVKYALNGDKRGTEFTCTAKGGDNVTIGDITEDAAASTFTIPVTAKKIIGTDVVMVRINNNGAYKERTVDVVIDSDDQPNVLGGQEADVRHYKEDYSFEAAYDELKTNGLTDGDKTTDVFGDIESPSTHKDDLWAIFTAPEGKPWNLAKVVVNIPNGNKGENDNGNEGFVNKNVKIAIGDDLTNLTTVKTFSNLQEVSELEYILPEYAETKYLAVICDLNAFFYPALAEVEAYEQVAEALQDDVALKVKGWNADVVAESLPAASSTDSDLDDSGWAFYTAGVQKQGSLCDASGKITTSSGRKYKIDPTAKNALKLDSGSDNVLTVEQPVACREVSMLIVSADAQARITGTITYDDGTTLYLSTRPKNWYSDEAYGDEAIYGLGRIYRSDDGEYDADQLEAEYCYRAYEYVIDTDPTKKVESISLSNSKWSAMPTVLAISKKASTVETGIGSATVSGGTQPAAVYTLSGMKTATLQRGLNIVKAADGSVKKVVVK